MDAAHTTLTTGTAAAAAAAAVQLQQLQLPQEPPPGGGGGGGGGGAEGGSDGGFTPVSSPDADGAPQPHTLTKAQFRTLHEQMTGEAISQEEADLYFELFDADRDGRLRVEEAGFWARGSGNGGRGGAS